MALLRLAIRPTATVSRFRFQQSKRSYITLEEVATNKAQKAQIYISRTTDPYVNLAIEHYFLTKTAPDATVLFLYTNRPSIVLGRNQNPWVEVNQGLLKKKLGSADKVDLVRRRSGGGTVFHDEGNVNYSVIFPTSAFDRDRHAHMIVRALRNLGVKQAKVNERHDIVLDVRPEMPEGEDIVEAELPLAEYKPLKISGSAYKLTRLRSLHHGTCLLSSPNIATIGQYLRSPAKPYIHAFGTPSVRSPITNVNVANEAFENAVVEEFGKMYGAVEPVEVDEVDVSDVREIADYYVESKSDEFTYEKTPQFKFSSEMTVSDDQDRPPLPDTIRPGAVVNFTARWGKITEAEVTVPEHGNFRAVGAGLVGHKIHEIKDWTHVLPSEGPGEWKPVGDWLNTLFR